MADRINRFTEGYRHAVRVYADRFDHPLALIGFVAGWRGPMPENDGAAAGVVAMFCGVDLSARAVL
jgi:hypothetical protein